MALVDAVGAGNGSGAGVEALGAHPVSITAALMRTIAGRNRNDGVI